MTNRAANNSVELAPLRKRSVVFLAIFIVVVPVSALIAMLAFPDQRPSPIEGAIAVVIVGAVVGSLLAVIRRRSISFEAGNLIIRATFYTRRIALEELDLSGAKVIDLQEHPERRPLLKTNGLAVPGLAIGSFRDRKRNKLFCLVTAPRVVMLPLHGGSRILVSPTHPQRLLDEIRDRAASTG